MRDCRSVRSQNERQRCGAMQTFVRSSAKAQNDPTPLAKSPDWLKAAPMRENLLASRRQSGQKQDPCPSLLNYNAKYKRLLPPFVISPTVSDPFQTSGAKMLGF